MTTIFDAYPNAVKRFQVRQKSDGAIQLLVVPNRSYPHSAAEISKVIAELERVVRHLVPVTVSEVPVISDDRGKNRFVWSDYRSAGQVCART